MEFIKTINAIKWKNGNCEKVEEKTVEDEYAYLFIDYLPPRKFSVYPKNLDDFAIGYCLGEGLIKTNNDIKNIKISETNVLVKTRLNHTPKEDFEQEGIVQKRKEIASMHAFADYLNIRE